MFNLNFGQSDMQRHRSTLYQRAIVGLLMSNNEVPSHMLTKEPYFYITVK